jgi:hypothetical protein
MSVYEVLRAAYPVDLKRFNYLLKIQYQVRDHPAVRQALLIGDPPGPMYQPRLLDGQLSLLSFNYMPLPLALIKALAAHPELVPPATQVTWTCEQDLLFSGTLLALSKQLGITA